MKLDIYLESRRLDIDADTQLAITYQFSDLTNPTTQTGDGSQTITIKGTLNNNAIFGQIWRLDRVTLLGGELNTSVYFNASKRTKCVIYINHEVFKRGYVKLNAIKSAKGVISYDVTFYSELVDVLHTLKESKLRDLPFPNDLRHTLNAATIRQGWEQGGAQGIFYYLAYVMANNGLYDEFESGKWLTGSYDNPQVADILPSGLQLDECAKREYRSYYQRPALRLKGLIDLIAAEHGIQLDPTFFNDGNPYYADSVMALPQYNIMEQTNNYTGLGAYGEDGTDNVITFSAASHNGIIVPSFKSDDGGGIISPTWSSAIELSAGGTGKSVITIELEYAITAHLKTPVFNNAEVKLFFVPDATYKSNGIFPTMMLENQEADNHMTANIGADKYQAVKNANGLYNAALYFVKKAGDDTKTARLTIDNRWNGLYKYYKGTGRTRVPIQFTSEKQVWKGLATFSVKITNPVKDTAGNDIFPSTLIYQYYSGGYRTGTVEVDYYEVRLYPITKAPANGGDLNAYYPATAGFTGNDITINVAKKIRSGYAVDKRDIIDDETTQGDFLINYAKLFGLLFYTDKDGTPHLVTRNTFFKDYKVEDWTDKIDHAKEIHQVPIPFDSRYLLLQYQDGGTFYEDYYRTQYDSEYGGQRINTGFEFDENETHLLPETLFYNTVMSNESTRVLLTDEARFIMQFQQDTKTLPAFFQKEDNQRTPTDTKFNLLFDNGVHRFNPEGNHQAIDPKERIWLTDDYEQMITADGGGQYCWIDTEHYIVDKSGGDNHYLIPELLYPLFSTLHKSGAFSWHLGYPLENYASWLRSQFPESSTLYANFWRNYIAEIYDVDNRIMTAYVRLTAADVAQFSFGNFVKIGDALWHVNKIEQFDPLGDGTTKVEFLRVSSLAAIENAYANGQTDMTYVAPPEPETFNVAIDLTNISSSASVTTVEDGEPFATTLTPASGYLLGNVIVTMGGQGITAQVYTANDDKTSGTISIPSVTGDVTIIATGVKKQYEVVLQLTNIESTEDDTTVASGDTFTAQLTATAGYRIDNVVVTMGGEAITAMEIGGVLVWQPNTDKTAGTITIAGVTAGVNIVASAVQMQPAQYRTIKVYSDIEGVIVESNGIQYRNLSMNIPADVKVYYGDGVTDGITIDVSQAGNLAGTPVLIYGLPKPRATTNGTTWDTLVTPSRIDSAGELYEYDDTDGDIEFDEGKTYVITELPAIGRAQGVVVHILVGQTVASYNGQAWTTLLTNVTADSANLDIPADSIALQFWNMGEREYISFNGATAAYDGLGDNILLPSYQLRGKSDIYLNEV